MQLIQIGTILNKYYNQDTEDNVFLIGLKEIPKIILGLV